MNKVNDAKIIRKIEDESEAFAERVECMASEIIHDLAEKFTLDYQTVEYIWNGEHHLAENDG